MEFVFSDETIILLFCVATIAGFIDTLAGGGGLLVLPMLLTIGMPPINALATNKVQSIGGLLSASSYFIQHKMVNFTKLKGILPATFIGAMLGVVSVQYLQASFLQKMVPLLLILVGGYFFFNPQLGKQQQASRLSLPQFAVIACLIGFYDGFFGPGAGSFYALAGVSLLGFMLSTATAYAKILNTTSNLAAIVLFILSGQVIWSIAIIMCVGQIIGARLAARLVITQGQRLIRPLLVIISVLMSGKLIYQQYGVLIQQWINQLFS